MTQFVHRSKQNKKKKRERDWVRDGVAESNPSAAAGPDSRQTSISRVTVRCWFLCRTNAAFCQLEPSVHVWSQTFCCLCPSVCSSAVFCFLTPPPPLHSFELVFFFGGGGIVWHLTESSGRTRHVSIKWSQGDIKTLVAIILQIPEMIT